TSPDHRIFAHARSTRGCRATRLQCRFRPTRCGKPGKARSRCEPGQSGTAVTAGVRVVYRIDVGWSGWIGCRKTRVYRRRLGRDFGAGDGMVFKPLQAVSKAETTNRGVRKPACRM